MPMTTVCTSVARGMESMDLGHIKVAKPDFLRARVAGQNVALVVSADDVEGYRQLLLGVDSGRADDGFGAMPAARPRSAIV